MANRHASFQRLPFPDETLYDDTQAQRFADLRTRLDACARSHLRGLGRIDHPAHQALADAVDGIRHHLRPACTPLNTCLLVWLPLATLLTYAAETPLEH